MNKLSLDICFKSTLLAFALCVRNSFSIVKSVLEIFKNKFNFAFLTFRYVIISFSKKIQKPFNCKAKNGAYYIFHNILKIRIIESKHGKYSFLFLVGPYGVVALYGLFFIFMSYLNNLIILCRIEIFAKDLFNV